MQRRYPAIRVILREASRARALTMLRDGETDIALIFDAHGEQPADRRGLASLPLVDEPFLIALPRTHPLTAKTAIELRELRNERWITGTAQDQPGAIERACLEAGFEPDIVAKADDQPTIQAIVAGGIAITLIPQLATRGACNDVIFRPIRPKPITRRISAISLDVKPRSYAVEALTAELAAIAAYRSKLSRPRVDGQPTQA